MWHAQDSNPGTQHDCVSDGIPSMAAILITLKLDEVLHIQTNRFRCVRGGNAGRIIQHFDPNPKVQIGGLYEANALTASGNQVAVILAPAIGGTGAVVLFAVLAAGFLKGTFSLSFPSSTFHQQRISSKSCSTCTCIVVRGGQALFVMFSGGLFRTACSRRPLSALLNGRETKGLGVRRANLLVAVGGGFPPQQMVTIGQDALITIRHACR